MLSIQHIAQALGGAKRNGSGWMARCPAHDDRKPSLSIAVGHSGLPLFHCFAGCDARNVQAIIRQRGILEGEITPPYRAKHHTPAARFPAPLEWSPRAERIWQSTTPIVGSPAEIYLHGRCCLIPNCTDLRFLASNTAMKYPAMVARITDAVTGKPITLHFTLLTADGSRKAAIERTKILLRGHRKAGGVIRLTDDADVTNGLGITEGIETALACAQMGWSPVWAAVDAGNIASFPVLDGIECLTIFADHDKAGISAAEACAYRWRASTREARIATPHDVGFDWADVAQGGVA